MLTPGDNRSTMTQIQVVVGMRSQRNCAALRARLARADNIEVAGAATDKPALGEALQTHRPQVVVAEMEMLMDVSRAGWENARARYPDTRLVLLAHGAPALPSRCPMLEYMAGLVFVDEVAEKIVPAVQAAAAGNVLLSRRGLRLVRENLRGGRRSALYHRLTARERDVLRLVAAGERDLQVAKALAISARTVHSHLQRIYRKLGVDTRTEAVAKAIRAGIIDE